MNEPSGPKARIPIRQENTEESYLKNKSNILSMKNPSVQHNYSHSFESEESSNDDSIENGEQMKIDQHEIDKNKQFRHSQNRSRTFSPEKTLKNGSKCSTPEVQLFKIKQDIESRKLKRKQEQKESKRLKDYLIIPFISVIFFAVVLFPYMYKTQEQPINHDNLLFKFIKNVKAKFHNQESDSWNDISSAINEVVSRSPKVPSIILLFANETNTMDCLATELAHVSSSILHTDHPKNFNPEDFGDNAGDVINTLKKNFPPVKVIVIRDILNINAEAIKALHFLCDKVSPLIDEAIYILTMQTNNYQPSKKRLTFVEDYIRRKLSKSIDQDILMPLITRITDGAVILVQPEPNLEHCRN
ncbi:uncharacterized protein TORIP isoform X2 [Linepithema humile]